jgi:pimeloyl-ACP methyl ester carboxylesterase
MEKSKLIKCLKYEKQILENTGLLPSEYTVADCQLTDSKKIHYVKIHKQPRSKKNVLVMTHGYFASNIVYFKMYQFLKEDFHIISFDSSGHGLSSYTKETPDSNQKWIDYFVDDIKTFVDKMGLKKFHIVGHSLGGYIMAHFLRKHPDMINQVFLLSPGGVNRENPAVEKRVKARFDNANCLMKSFANSMINKIFKEKESPMDHFFAKCFRGFIIKRFYGDRLKLSKDEKKLFGELFLEISKAKPSSEKCLGHIFKMGPVSEIPIMPILREMQSKKRICIMYGSTDWMDHQLTREIIEKEELDIDVETVENAGHQLIFQNPRKVAQYIKYYCFVSEDETGELNDPK